jgi:hypothetical protein
MHEYIPLCSPRLKMLPEACRSCAWWQTAGQEPAGKHASAEKRAEWQYATEASFGTTGLIATGDGHPVAVIQYAPASVLPRVRSLNVGKLPDNAVVLFCLHSIGVPSPLELRRLLHKTMAVLRQRGLLEVYALAQPATGARSRGRCSLFELEFLDGNGFQRVTDNGEVFVLRADLRGLLSSVSQLERAFRRLFRSDPEPTPAAWSRR